MTETGSQVSQIDTWRFIDGLSETYSDWTVRWVSALPAQREALKTRLDNAIGAACDAFNLIGPQDYPVVEEGAVRPPSPDGRMYFDDWSQAMKEAAIKQYEAAKLSQGFPR